MKGRKKKMATIEELTAEERIELGEHYVKNYAWAFKGLVQLCAEACCNKDNGLLLFAAETVNALLQSSWAKIDDEADEPKIIAGWPLDDSAKH